MEIFSLKKENYFSSNCYIVISDGEFAVIDPSVAYSSALEQIPKLSDFIPKYVILTHAHIDHFFEINSYVSLGMTVLISHHDSLMLSDREKNADFLFGEDYSGYFGKYVCIEDGAEISVGSSKLQVIATPGHTEGSVSLLCKGALFTGDTLFARGFGRYDLYSGSGSKLFDSIRKLLSHDDSLIVYSGHGNEAILADIKHNFDY